MSEDLDKFELDTDTLLNSNYERRRVRNAGVSQTILYPKKCKKSSTKLYSFSLIILFVFVTLYVHFLRKREMRISKGVLYNMTFHSEYEKFHSVQDKSIANDLFDHVRVACLVILCPEKHDTAKYIKETWGKRCNQIFFMSSEKDVTIPTVDIATPRARKFDCDGKSWEQTRNTFKFAYDNLLEDFDWFIKVGPDTYLILENLRYMLSKYNPSRPVYLGCKLRPFIEQGYMAGAPGYILSKPALKKFVETITMDELKKSKSSQCLQNSTNDEDVQMGMCMNSLKIKVTDSRDIYNRYRFFMTSPEEYIFHQDLSKPHLAYAFNNIKQGMECCSDYAVSFHPVTEKQLFFYEYLLYHVRPYGIKFGTDTSVVKTKFVSTTEENPPMQVFYGLD